MKAFILAVLFVFLSIPIAYAYNPEVEVLEQDLRRAKNEQRMEYYRGIYDTCMFSAYLAGNPISQSVKPCLEFTDKARKNKWYEQDSPGWQWPMIDTLGLMNG